MSTLLINTTYSPKDWIRRPWHDASAQRQGTKLFRIELTHVYEGDITGEGAVQYLISQNEKNEVNFVGFERVTASISGQSGSFILQRIGAFENGKVKETLTILPGSGTGGLQNFRGSACIEHTEHQDHYSIVLNGEL